MHKLTFDCQSHPGEVITNICCLKSCLTPLCPDCIDEHNKKHMSEQTQPEIDTLKRVQVMSSNKLESVNSTLANYLAKLNSATNIDLEKTIHKSLSELESIRKKLVDQVNAYFKSLQEEFIAKTQATMNTLPDFSDLKSKINGIMDEVASIRNNIGTANTLEAIKCTINLDSDALYSNVEKWINDAISTMIAMPSNLVFKNNYSAEFFAELRNIVTLETKEVKLVTNERQLNLQLSYKEDKSQALIKSYFDSKFKLT